MLFGSKTYNVYFAYLTASSRFRAVISFSISIVYLNPQIALHSHTFWLKPRIYYGFLT